MILLNLMFASFTHILSVIEDHRKDSFTLLCHLSPHPRQYSRQRDIPSLGKEREMNIGLCLGPQHWAFPSKNPPSGPTSLQICMEDLVSSARPAPAASGYRQALVLEWPQTFYTGIKGGPKARSALTD
jgi:hypothetical protein